MQNSVIDLDCDLANNTMEMLEDVVAKLMLL
jgi:hypothetical protein